MKRTTFPGFILLAVLATSIVGRVDAQAIQRSDIMRQSEKAPALGREFRSDTSGRHGRLHLASGDQAGTSEKTQAWHAPLAGALIGGAVGAVAGFVLYEVAEETIDIGLCNEGSPGCESHMSPTLIESMLIFGAIGAGIGAIIGLASQGGGTDDSAPLRTVLLPHPNGPPAVGVSYRLRLR